MRKDLDSSYVMLVSRWQEEDRRAAKIRQEKYLQEKANRAGGTVIAALFVITMVIAYIGGI